MLVSIPEFTAVILDFQNGNLPCVGSGVVRIDPLCFLAGCRKWRLNQSVYHIIILACLTLHCGLLRAHSYVLLVFVCMCSVFKLFWLSRHYLPSDWLEKLL